MTRNIPVAGPSITEKEQAYIADAAKTGWYAHANDYILRFEQAFAAHLGRRHAISLPSCTSGLHLSLLALGIGGGDEVIVPDGTWIASAAPVSYVGATPVFADIEPESWCLSARTVEAALTPRTKAVIVVNLYGHMPDWDALRTLAEKHNLALIEDAAQSIGSTFRGQPAGSFGETSCFSFHGSKTLTTGEGGMFVTDDDTLHARAMQLRDHGRAPGDTLFRNLEVGYKYKMTALQAALGLAQLERVEELVAKKRQVFAWYQERLWGVDGLSLNPAQPEVYNSYWMTTLLWDAAFGIGKVELIERLASQGIATRPFFEPLSSLPAYAHLRDGYAARNPNAYALAARGINLPSALCLTEDDVDYVCEALRGIFTR